MKAHVRQATLLVTFVAYATCIVLPFLVIWSSNNHRWLSFPGGKAFKVDRKISDVGPRPFHYLTIRHDAPKRVVVHPLALTLAVSMTCLVFVPLVCLFVAIRRSEPNSVGAPLDGQQE